MAVSFSFSAKLLSFLLSFPLIFTFFTHATIFEIHNQCPYTVWAAAQPGGGRQLKTGQSWILNMKPSIRSGRVWGRTNCTFNSSGQGNCTTGDCNGLLQCRSSGSLPITMAEYTLSAIDNIDYLDMSLVDGFNIPMDLIPRGALGIRCRADINSQCPTELRVADGCNGPCVVFQTDEYCCIGTHNTLDKCGPTSYSKFFKKYCPDAYTYPYDQVNDPASTLKYPSGTKYNIVFCGPLEA
ncbi:hypothetical protein AQUCO_02500275v1 [Aquilegia coerulea]|uniref:Thaumatin-like protein n=1 Tax=Aquilegia coerulea TaxID=218851 RepID=A0A2G5DAD7_AQUCA|nr:hypothetical protein AQUCO_02500275v1 [Aquilegia coerulea]